MELTQGQFKRVFEAFEAIPLKGKDTMTAADNMVAIRGILNSIDNAIQKVFDSNIEKGARQVPKDHPAFDKVVSEMNLISDRKVTVSGLVPITEDGLHTKAFADGPNMQGHISVLKFHGLLVKELPKDSE